MKAQSRILLILLAGVSSLAFGQDAPKPAARPSTATSSAASVEQIGDKIRVANGSTSGQALEIVKMSDAGVDEKTILGYIDSLPAARVKSDDIIYLHEKGISSAIITAWLQHANSAPAPQTQVAAAPAVQTAPAQPAQPVATPVYVEQTPPVYVSSPTVVYTAPYYYPYYSSYCYPRYYGGPYFSFGFSTRSFPNHFYGGHSFHVGHTFGNPGFHGHFRH